VVSRKQPDQKSCDTHDEECKDQHGFAADLVTEVTTDNSTDGTRGEPDGIGAERGQRAGQRIVVWEKEFPKDQRTGSAIEEEVIPFDCGANETGNRHLPDCGAVGV